MPALVGVITFTFDADSWTPARISRHPDPTLLMPAHVIGVLPPGRTTDVTPSLPAPVYASIRSCYTLQRSYYLAHYPTHPYATVLPAAPPPFGVGASVGIACLHAVLYGLLLLCRTPLDLPPPVTARLVPDCAVARSLPACCPPSRLLPLLLPIWFNVKIYYTRYLPAGVTVTRSPYACRYGRYRAHCLRVRRI